MLRTLHKYAGLFATVLVLVLALSGITLSVMPAWNKAQAPAMSETGLSVADLAARVSAVIRGSNRSNVRLRGRSPPIILPVISRALWWLIPPRARGYLIMKPPPRCNG